MELLVPTNILVSLPIIDKYESNLSPLIKNYYNELLLHQSDYLTVVPKVQQ